MALINYVTRIHLANNVVDDALPAELHAVDAYRPLILTDARAVDEGLLDRALSAIPTSVETTVFPDTPPVPTEGTAIEAAALFRDRRCDSIVSLGGEVVIDLGKVTGLQVSHAGPLRKYAAIEGGMPRIQDILPPFLAIPTTAGTGNEVGNAAVIVLNDGRKLAFVSPFLIPRVAICDPVLTVGTPPGITAGTGMDAMTHCIETYLARAYNPPADGIALDGLRRVSRHIARAVENGTDLIARSEMMAASINGALAMQKGLGAVHAMSHALGGLSPHRLHHGTLNAVLLPHVLDFNAPAVGHRYLDLKEAFGISGTADLSEAIQSQNARLGLPPSLGAMGVDPEVIDQAAELAERDHTHGTNPRRAMAKDYRDIMRQAL